MNKTNQRCDHPVYEWDAEKAEYYFAQKYPNIRYDTKTDSFILNGVAFDYIKSRNCIEDGKRWTFILVDKKYPDIMLFENQPCYTRWKNYLRAIEERKFKFPNLFFMARHFFRKCYVRFAMA